MAVVEFMFAGLSLKLDDVNGSDFVARNMVTGAFEAPLPLIMAATYCRTKGIFVDVGANTGLYSVLLGKLDSNRKVVGFEPMPEVFEFLNRNVELNNLTNVVETRRRAMSDHRGRASLFIPDESHSLVVSAASLNSDFVPASTSVEVDVGLLDDEEFPDQIGVIKVDIEGHEPLFLSGARSRIEKDRPILFVEILSQPRADEIMKIMSPFKYKYYRLRKNEAIKNENIIADNDAWNHVLVPTEKQDVFHSACGRHELPIRFE